MKTRTITTLVFLSLFFCMCKQTKQPTCMILLDNWKFKTGDSLIFANPDYNDDDWRSINPAIYWEQQGLPEYDGYAWYRVTFNLPDALRKNAFFKDSVLITIGKIDDTEQTFLNGEIIGENARSIPVRQKPDSFEGDNEAYRLFRSYLLAVRDPRLKWNKQNILAIRVHDHGGMGGLYELDQQTVSMLDVKDFVKLDYTASPLRVSGDSSCEKTLLVRNLSAGYSFSGLLSAEVKNDETGKVIFTEAEKISVKPGESFQLTMKFNADITGIHIASYRFEQQGARVPVEETEVLPYILTPKASDMPRINGAKIIGSRPGNEFLFAIPATGKRPLEYAAENLPPGLKIDPETGIITGITPRAGKYVIYLVAKNRLGECRRELTIVSGNNLALTPPMGWNSWNCWGLSVDAGKVKQAADYMVSSGLRDHGWTYINIDDGWETDKRKPSGEITGNEKFPDFKELSEYVHGKGLKLGIYSSPGPLTCGGYLGTYGHEMQDARSYARWGIDYLKYDWCSYGQIARDNSLPELKKPYQVMREAINQSKRDIVFSLCQYGMGNVWEWGEGVGGNLWRTTGDITDTWASMSGIGFNQSVQGQYAGPGHWNDPDMLILGWVGWGPSLHPTRLSASEQYTHISLWALLAAPLLLGNDLSRLDDFTLNLLTNDEVLAINQDPLGKQARQVKVDDMTQVWLKELEDGSKAVGIFNLDNTDKEITVNWSDLNMTPNQEVRDVWRQKDMGVYGISFTVRVLSHDVALLVVRPQNQ
jgi:alpha-galactosidase